MHRAFLVRGADDLCRALVIATASLACTPTAGAPVDAGSAAELDGGPRLDSSAPTDAGAGADRRDAAPLDDAAIADAALDDAALDDAARDDAALCAPSATDDATCDDTDDDCDGRVDEDAPDAGGLCVPPPPPSVDAVEPRTLVHGARVTITGAHLAAARSVTIDGAEQLVAAATAERLEIVVSDETPIGRSRALRVGGAAVATVDVVRLLVEEVDAEALADAEHVELVASPAGSVDLEGYRLVVIGPGREGVLHDVALGRTDAAGSLLVGGSARAPDVALPPRALPDRAGAVAIVRAREPVALGTEARDLASTAGMIVDAVVYGVALAPIDPELAWLYASPARPRAADEARFDGALDAIHRCEAGRRDARAFSGVGPPAPRARGLCPLSTSDVQDLLDSRCDGCHGGMGGFFVTSPFTAATLGVPSSQLPSMPRITAGDHRRSYLFHKVADTHLAAGGGGGRMPPVGEQLDAITLRRLALHIDAL